MEVSKKTLRFFCKDSEKYEIPYFQRPYVWDEEEWRNLLSSLLESDDDTHFLGTLIVKSIENKKSTEDRFYSVVDGQQRITTLLILLKVCLEIIEKEAEKTDKEISYIKNIKNALFYRKNEYEEVDVSKAEIKLKHSINDSKSFDAIIRGNIKDKELDEDIKESNLYKCYQYFRAKGNEKNRIYLTLNNAIKVVEIVLKQETNLDEDKDNLNYLFLLIKLSKNESEQKIFNTINSLGVQLTTAENIKNTLYQEYAIAYKDKDGGKNFYTKTWEAVFEDVQSIKFWNKSVGSGVQAKSNIDLLLQYVAVNEGILTPDANDNNIVDKMHNYYTSFIKKKNNDVKKLIYKIMSYAIIYKELFDDIETITSYSDSHKRLAHIIYYSGSMTICSYVLRLYYENTKKQFSKCEDYNNINYKLPSDSDFKKKTKDIESLIVRYILISDNVSKIKNFNKKIAPIMRKYKSSTNVIKEIIKDKKGNEAKVSDKDLENGIKYIKNNQYARLVLFWIEYYRMSGKEDRKMNLITFKCSLEHVLPQKYSDSYPVKKYPVYVDGKKLKNLEDMEETRARMVYSIGNMTICKKSANSAYSNAYIKDKVEGKKVTKKDSSYKDNENIKLTKEIIDTYERNKKKKRKDALWDERDIEKREQQLYKEINKIWPLKY